MSHASHDDYYVPHGTNWPIIGTIGLTTLFVGFSNYLNGNSIGTWFMLAGTAIVIYMLFRWFGEVIDESLSGKYSDQVDTSFRMSMGWFIFSEVMFFAAFFGALFYARVLSIPWLGGEGDGVMTNAVLWSGFEAAWPTNGPGEVGGDFQIVGAWGIPAINTLILLTSGVTVTFAHWALKQGNNSKTTMWLAATVALGFIFVGLQAYEYQHAWSDLNLTMGSGIYGSTFYMLTGFHGLHVTIGAIMLFVMMLRSAKGHFSPHNHFAFEAAAWYWHFVDVVWLGLFIFVYWL
jgi:cytochrome c oxidase subunit 3